jgi:thiamine biosynthesis lipoprotein
VGVHTFECLRLSLLYWEETGGAFDATLGALSECWVAKDRSLRHPAPEELQRAAERTGMGSLVLDEAGMSVRLGATVPFLDLGAIGKGYAVDRAADLLKEWGVGAALVHGGTSSVFAFGRLGDELGWPVTLSDPVRTSEVIERVILTESGLGGSGIRKGRHIIDPRRGVPADGRRAAWVMSESAARSDALSTACMVMNGDEIRTMIERDARLRAVVVEESGGRTGGGADGAGQQSTAAAAGLLRFGMWTSA